MSFTSSEDGITGTRFTLPSETTENWTKEKKPRFLRHWVMKESNPREVGNN